MWYMKKKQVLKYICIMQKYNKKMTDKMQARYCSCPVPQFNMAYDV